MKERSVHNVLLLWIGIDTFTSHGLSLSDRPLELFYTDSHLTALVNKQLIDPKPIKALNGSNSRNLYFLSSNVKAYTHLAHYKHAPADFK